MRGIRDPRGLRVDWDGISPAHAGNTSENIFRYGTLADQPRTCGEYILPQGGAGSQRISPAHAGNTGLTAALPRGAMDQPRTCGEYPIEGNPVRFSAGSAPHMRGIPSLRV